MSSYNAVFGQTPGVNPSGFVTNPTDDVPEEIESAHLKPNLDQKSYIRRFPNAGRPWKPDKTG